MPGPTPTTPEGYIIQLFERFNLFMDKYEEDREKCQSDFAQVCKRLDDHDTAIESLKRFDSALVEFQKGRSSLWISYKEPILIIFSLGLGAVLALWGLK